MLSTCMDSMDVLMDIYKSSFTKIPVRVHHQRLFQLSLIDFCQTKVRHFLKNYWESIFFDLYVLRNMI